MGGVPPQEPMRAHESNDISTVLNAVSGMFSPPNRENLAVFLEELFRWNPQLGLVSKKDTSTVVIRLVEQSVRIWDLVSGSIGDARARTVRRILDIGAGGGFPGFVWKLLVPRLEVVLVERKTRKTVFLERVIARAGLAGVEILAVDVREIARQGGHRGSFDLAVMMAVADPRTLSDEIETLLADGGHLCAVRGRHQSPPDKTLGRRLTLGTTFETPHGKVVLYEKRLS